jgi:hypothetical protein
MPIQDRELPKTAIRRELHDHVESVREIVSDMVSYGIGDFCPTI